jgi:hypothetical protein
MDRMVSQRIEAFVQRGMRVGTTGNYTLVITKHVGSPMLCSVAMQAVTNSDP